MKHLHCLVCNASLAHRSGGQAKYCLKCYRKANTAGGAGRAYAAVARAIKGGVLPRASTLKCVDCGVQARDYDHRDYSNPLAVQPVCRPCNLRRGPALKVAA